MMPVWFWLLASYGLCFGLAHKVVPFFHGRLPILDKLSRCPFCLGVHTGWMVALVAGTPASQIPAWCFASAAACYLLDGVAVWCSRR